MFKWEDMWALGDEAAKDGISLFTYPTTGYFDAFTYAVLASAGGIDFFNRCTLSDKFNSKKAGNCDWQFNVLVGLNIKLGKSYKKTAPVYYEPEPIVEQPKPQPVVKQPEPEPVAVVVEPMKQNIFFALNSALLQKDQQSKIDAMVAYMEKYPASKVAITGYADKETGYADKETGNPRINMTLSEKRAKIVADALKAKGIAADRIVTDFKGDTVQPFRVPEENRVSVCIAE